MAESISFDPAADYYDQTRVYPPEVSDRIAGALIAAGHIPTRGHILEIGIGTGRIALPLLARGISITGVDISPRMVERLREKYDAARAAEPLRDWGRLTVELLDISALPFPDATFDAVVGVHILHLVPEWKRALDEAMRVLKPGGALLLGWDTRQGTAQHHIHDEWERIVTALGYEPHRVGAQDSAEVLAVLRARGLPVQERVVTSWSYQVPPRRALDSITRREWSQTWLVPDDLFAESARRLTAWADAEFGPELDVPERGTYSFKLAVVPKHP
jgi:ubiquinone/menaquinone biosynthesis C-methylase UbiE